MICSELVSLGSSALHSQSKLSVEATKTMWMKSSDHHFNLCSYLIYSKKCCIMLLDFATSDCGTYSGAVLIDVFACKCRAYLGVVLIRGSTVALSIKCSTVHTSVFMN